jgi:hypothetical protein
MEGSCVLNLRVPLNAGSPSSGLTTGGLLSSAQLHGVSSWAPQGPDIKKNWPTDQQSEYNLNLKVQVNPMSGGITGPPCSWGI